MNEIRICARRQQGFLQEPQHQQVDEDRPKVEIVWRLKNHSPNLGDLPRLSITPGTNFNHQSERKIEEFAGDKVEADGREEEEERADRPFQNFFVWWMNVFAGFSGKDVANQRDEES